MLSKPQLKPGHWIIDTTQTAKDVTTGLIAAEGLLKVLANLLALVAVTHADSEGVIK